MKVNKILLRNFRNYTEAVIEPNEGFNIFSGDNAQGKTNLLEAIYMLGYLRGFRPGTNEDLVRVGESAGVIDATTESNQVSRSIKIVISDGSKKATLDGKSVRNASSVISCLRPILFSPEDVHIAKGSPGGRRDLIDRGVFQANPDYLKTFHAFEKTLRHRNRLLKKEAPAKEIEPWTESLLEAGARVRVYRSRYLLALTPHFEEAYRRISNSEQASIFYPAMQPDLKAARERIKKEMEALSNKEKYARTTLWGPHRDDPSFFVDGKDARIYASQGQQRSLILAFKTGQTHELEDRHGETPVLLLDDMTSELDAKRRQFFYNFLLERRGQVFITTTTPELLEQGGFDNAKFYQIKDGEVLV